MPSLNPHHRRALEVVLRMLEETLDHIATQLSTTPLHGVLYEVHNPFSPQQEYALRQRIEEIREILRQAREKWHLRVEQKRLDGIIRSAMAILWADLEDCLSSQLCRYGEVPPSLQPDVDEMIHQLIRLTQNILS